MITHNPCTIANEFIGRARKDGRTLDALQLNKLVYFSHAWMLGMHHRPLLDQPIKAWKFGPIIPNLFRATQTGIYTLGDEIDLPSLQISETLPDRQQMDVINQVYELYGEFKGAQLSSMAHTDGTPWHRIWQSHGAREWEEERRNATIPDPMLEDYYGNQIDEMRPPKTRVKESPRRAPRRPTPRSPRRERWRCVKEEVK